MFTFPFTALFPFSQQIQQLRARFVESLQADLSTASLTWPVKLVVKCETLQEVWIVSQGGGVMIGNIHSQFITLILQLCKLRIILLWKHFLHEMFTWSTTTASSLSADCMKMSEQRRGDGHLTPKHQSHACRSGSHALLQHIRQRFINIFHSDTASCPVTVLTTPNMFKRHF